MSLSKLLKKKTKKLLSKLGGFDGFASDIGLANEANRIRWVSDTLKKIPNNSKLLDAGAGECQYKQYCSHLQYVSQDFARYDGKGNDIGLQTKKWDNTQIDIVSDITAIPVPDSSFDVVMCTEVLEHIINPNDTLRELDRVLKKGGYMIITAPFCSLTHFAPYHYATGFSRFFYEEFCKNNGYDIIELSPNGNYFHYLAQELRRLDVIFNQYSDKQLTNEAKSNIDSLLLTLNEAGKLETKSSELLCYGYHFFAVKK